MDIYLWETIILLFCLSLFMLLSPFWLLALFTSLLILQAFTYIHPILRLLSLCIFLCEPAYQIDTFLIFRYLIIRHERSFVGDFNLHTNKMADSTKEPLSQFFTQKSNLILYLSFIFNISVVNNRIDIQYL